MSNQPEAIKKLLAADLHMKKELVEELKKTIEK